MARKVKCRKCDKQIDIGDAYKVSKGKTNYYYCNIDEYLDIQDKIVKRKSCLETLANVMNYKFIPPSLEKQLDKIKEYYDYSIIERTIKEYERNIRWFLDNKASENEFANMKYIVTIIANNINAVHKKWQQEQKEMERLFAKEDTVDVEIMEVEIKVKKDVSDISDFLD